MHTGATREQRLGAAPEPRAEARSEHDGAVVRPGGIHTERRLLGKASGVHVGFVFSRAMSPSKVAQFHRMARAVNYFPNLD